jgi:D-sedoheptulose 7-phosphate isomerase
LKAQIEESSRIIGSLADKTEEIAQVCSVIIDALKSGCKVLTAGNGGSAAEALHMSEELVGRFRADRRSLAAVSLAADPTAMTCIGNDYGFERIFSRQVEGLGRPGDVLMLFSTSGKSENLRLALAAAGECGMKTVCLLGRDGGPMAGKADLEIIVSGNATERIQEAHQVLVHLILDAVEDEKGFK